MGNVHIISEKPPWNFCRSKQLTTGRKRVTVIKKAIDHWSKNREEKKIMTYAELFSAIKGEFMKADVSDISEHLAYQFNITGEAEGIFYVEVKDGRLYVEPYEYFDRDVIFICSAKTLLKLSEGKMDPVMAVTLQKLKFEGSVEKALRLKELIDSKRK